MAWTVLRVVGEEAVSELFSFTLHLLAARADLEREAGGSADLIELAAGRRSPVVVERSAACRDVKHTALGSRRRWDHVGAGITSAIGRAAR